MLHFLGGLAVNNYWIEILMRCQQITAEHPNDVLITSYWQLAEQSQQQCWQLKCSYEQFAKIDEENNLTANTSKWGQVQVGFA